MEYTHAAVRIQAIWRGRRARRLLSSEPPLGAPREGVVETENEETQQQAPPEEFTILN